MGDWKYFAVAFLVPWALYGMLHAGRRFKARKWPGGGA